MKIKTSIAIISGCLVIFLFLMLPVFLSIQNQKEDLVASFKGSTFSLKDVNNNTITEKSFEGPLTAIFFWFYKLSRYMSNDVKQYRFSY